ncbi:MAG: sensor domain-containing diguanylate cyclase [Gammaproteobacteria bacterium]
MIRLSIPTRNPARDKHPRRESARPASSPVVACLFFALGIVFIIGLRGTALLPGEHWGALVFFAGFQFVLMFLSVPATAFGATAQSQISFDRLSLVAAILLFGPVPAAWAGGAAALAFTLAANPYGEPWWRRAIHALGNGGMYLLATLAAGYVWLALGGKVPIENFGPISVDRTAVLIIALQGTNEVLYAAMRWRNMDAASRRRLVHWQTALLEFVIAWTGVAAALAFLTLPLPGFALYVLLILVIAALLKFSVHTAERERRRAKELEAVNRVNQAVDSLADIDELAEVILREAGELVPFAAFLIGLYSPQSSELNIRLNYDAGTRHPQRRFKLGEGVLTWVLKSRKPVFITDTRKSDHPSLRNRAVAGRPSIAIIAVPIVFRNELVGVMSVQDYRAKAFQPEHLRLIEGFAQQIAVAIVNTHLFEELQGHRKELEARVARRTLDLERTSGSLRKAIEQKEALLERLERENRRDALTGLANRRHLDEILRQEHYRARRFGHPLSVAIGDLDRFKEVNDRWGHEIGDKALQEIANILCGELRATDLVARFGGEEFVVVLPETTEETAFAICEKLRARIAGHDWNRLTIGFALTMSFGITASRGGEKNRMQLLADADRALYQAKNDGRDRVCIAERQTEPS